MAAQPLAQPDFVALGGHLAAAGAEILLIPNIPNQVNQHNQIMVQLAQMQAQLVNMQAQNNAMQAQNSAMQAQNSAMQAQKNAIQAQLGEMQDQLNDLQAGQNLLLIRLHNASVSLDAPLQYPANINAPLVAQTKRQVLNLTIANCQAVAAVLNLQPELANNAHVEDRRQQIMDYLGCGIVAN